MKQSGVEVNAHVSYRGVGFFVYDCKVFGDTDECVYEVWSTLFLLSIWGNMDLNELLSK